jgi:hypothetical protein
LLARLIRDYAERAHAPLVNVERHVMRIGSHYGFLFGTGVVHGFLAEYYRDGEPTPIVAAKTLARGIGSSFIGGETIRRMARPFRGAVEFEDGTRWDDRDYLTVTAGTVEHIGLNFKPFRRYAEQPGTFHMLGIYASPVGLVRDLPRVHRGEPMRPGKTYDALSARAVVCAAGGTLPYMIDGDLHETRGELQVSIGPRVRLVVGR